MGADGKQTSSEELLQMAIRAAKGGHREGARVMLRQLCSRDQRNETALLWLAKIARTRQERLSWLNRILEINPENEVARKAVEQITYQSQAAENRTLLVFGSLATIMVILTFFVIIIAFTA